MNIVTILGLDNPNLRLPFLTTLIWALFKPSVPTFSVCINSQYVVLGLVMHIAITCFYVAIIYINE